MNVPDFFCHCGFLHRDPDPMSPGYMNRGNRYCGMSKPFYRFSTGWPGFHCESLIDPEYFSSFLYRNTLLLLYLFIFWPSGPWKIWFYNRPPAQPPGHSVVQVSNQLFKRIPLWPRLRISNRSPCSALGRSNFEIETYLAPLLWVAHNSRVRAYQFSPLSKIGTSFGKPLDVKLHSSVFDEKFRNVFLIFGTQALTSFFKKASTRLVFLNVSEYWVKFLIFFQGGPNFTY